MSQQSSPFCRYCGARISPGAALCEQCRNPLGETTALPAAPTIPIQQLQQPADPYAPPAQPGYQQQWQQPGYQQQWQQPVVPPPTTAPLRRSSVLPIVAGAALALALMVLAVGTILLTGDRPTEGTADAPPRPTAVVGGKQPVAATAVAEPTNDAKAPIDAIQIAVDPIPVPSVPGTPFTITPYDAPLDLPPLEYWLEMRVVSSSDEQDVKVYHVLTIRNTSAEYYFTGIDYEIEAYDAAGNRIDSTFGMFTLGPGEVTVQADSSPMYTSAALFDHVEIVFEQENGWAYPAELWPGIPLAVREVELTQGSIGPKASGEVVIGGSETLESIWISLVVRDHDGELLAAEQMVVEQLVPGKPIPFDTSLIGLELEQGMQLAVYPSLSDFFTPER